MTDQQQEVEELLRHLESRGLDPADSISVCATLIGVHVGLAAPDEDGARQRVEIVASWIQDSALRIVRSLRGQSGARLQ